MVKTPKKLNTFILVDKDRTLSPVLTTIREYGRWLQENYDEYTCNYELFMKAIVDGKSVLTYHPGTRIGKFFDSNTFTKDTMKSWFIYQDSSIINKLVKQKLTEMRDCIPISVNDVDHRRMLRVYTIDQIELYIRNNIDKDFVIDNNFLVPRQIKLDRTDAAKLIKPQVSKRKTLLQRCN